MEEQQTKITAEDVLGYINSVKEFLSENPQVIDAASHVVKNGIKQGGYDVVKAAVDGIISGGNVSSMQNIGASALNGLNAFRSTEEIECEEYQEYEEDDENEQCVLQANQQYNPQANQQYNLPANQQQNNKVSTVMVGGGAIILGGINKTSQLAGKASEGLTSLNTNMQSLTENVNTLAQNTSKFRGSLANFKKAATTPINAQKVGSAVAEYGDDAAELLNYGVTETAVSTASSTLSKAVSSAASGGLAGAVIGVTTEAIQSYKKFKNGEITQEEYQKEIAKSGGQMGISGAATAGITTALKVPIAGLASTMGVAAPLITIPISIIVGKGIDKIIAPAFGKGEYKKILDDAKYYQNLMHAHDDLVNAIAMSEQQFVEFIDEYQRQLVLHEGLKDTNRQLKQLHAVADRKLQQQQNQINSTFGALNDLYNKI